MKEIWKDIKGYEGSYQVSNLGNVKSLDRLDSAEHKLKGKMLNPGYGGRGYSIIRLYKFGKGRNWTVHQLVAIAFLNHNTCGHKLVVDHIDNDRNNNKLSNLQVITHRENISKNIVGKNNYTGVYLKSSGGKFVARCFYNGKKVYLGVFKTELEASEVYNNFVKSIEHDNIQQD